MQLEEAPIVEITTMMECVDNENPVIQIVRTHQHNTTSATVRTAISLKIELHGGTRQIKDIIAKSRKKDGERKGCLDSSNVT